VDNIEPLPITTWLEAIEKHARRCEGAGNAALERQLRHAFHLSQLTPFELRDAVQSNASEEEFEELLEEQKFDEAAEALASAGDLSVEQVASERFVARIAFAGASNSAEADSRACAILTAWLNCIAAFKQPSQAAIRKSSSSSA